VRDGAGRVLGRIEMAVSRRWTKKRWMTWRPEADVTFKEEKEMLGQPSNLNESR
jgi:hypothetical protein